ncbi:MAG: fibronectin type III domain-containing protein [Kofleriaceae bacterium]
MSVRWMALSLALIAPSGTAVAAGNCTTIAVDYLPAAQADNPFAPQMVAWLEQADGTYVDTMFITQQTGTYGIGNRPGRFDFNSGPNWPYGRRTTVFPVWAHRHGLSWETVVFQNGGDSELSHPFTQSSREQHFCRPLQSSEPAWDAMSCASAAFTDKGTLSEQTSLYPPRNDLTKSQADTVDVNSYNLLNPFDAVSQATPRIGTPATFTWPVPETLAPGNYVMVVEVSREFDMNTAYNPTTFPAPSGIAFGDYGEPYRGQPSVLYRVPFTILADAESTALTSEYIGYGDPEGLDGSVRTPDSTITLDIPGSGASRLQLVSNAGTTYRLRLTSRPQTDLEPPAVPGNLQVLAASQNAATIAFTAPGDDGTLGTATKLDIRFVVGQEMTEELFATAPPIEATVLPSTAGAIQSFDLTGLLPETAYSIGVRAIDDCRNASPLAVTTFVTPEREVGSVDACFIATAAYGSAMASEVGMLRRFRDVMLRKTVAGELAVEIYYTFSPALSNVVGESDLLRATARDLLGPIVTRVKGLKVER